MSSTDALKSRALMARGIVNQVVDDTPVAIRLRYIGTGTVTSVTVTTGTSLVSIATEGTKTYLFNAITTVGALADAINADGIFEARVLDALRADTISGNQLVTASPITASTDGNGVIIYDVLVDTSVLKALTATLVYSRDFFTNKLGTLHRVHLQQIDYNANVSGAEAGAVRVYLRRGSVETKVFAQASVVTTLTSINFASGLGRISGLEGDAIIVRVLDGTSITNAPADFLRASGIAE